MSLKDYDKKRDFSKTKEPKGELKKQVDRELVFVVQKHDASRLHYDFRLEWDGVLLSWAIPKGPSYNSKDKRLAVEVEAHPYDYRDFEGTIPKGEYGGGTVMLWDEGTWEPQEGLDVDKGLKEGSLKIILKGERLKGKWALVRMKPREGEEDKNWLLIKEKDDFTLDTTGTEDFTTSVRTGRSMEEITQGDQLEEVDVQLATLKESIPKGKHWIYELKYDGYRMMAYVDGDNSKLLSRNKKDYSETFKDILKDLKALDKRLVIDGEIVMIRDGKSHFQALQQYVKTKKGTPQLMAFDLLYLDHEDLREKPLLDRKNALKALLEELDGSRIQYAEGSTEDPEAIFKAVCEAGMEGIICKRKDRSYHSGRNEDWIKVKCKNEQEFFIAGYTQTESRTRAFSALLLGTKDGDDLIYAGRVGTGFNEANAKEILGKLKSLSRKTSPLKDAPKKRSGEEIFWVTPSLQAEVNFTEFTDEGLLRQASFKKLLEKQDVKTKGSDKKAKKVEEPSGEVSLSSPDKQMFKDYTKKDLFNYYERISERMLPYVQNRLLSLMRCPGGVEKECFYQKHLQDEIPGLYQKTINESDGKEADYIYLQDVSGILQAVQYNTIEFHGWGSSIEDLERPDMLVFDLDPDEGLSLEDVRQGVKDLKGILDELGLESFLKTSGGKGYHVVVPLIPKATWDQAKEFSKQVAQVMETQWPKKYTSNMNKSKRKDKIYIDWVRNGRGATSVAPYSVRARATGTVSWPISWKDLDKVAPADMTMQKALKSRKKDPWENFFSVKQSIGT